MDNITVKDYAKTYNRFAGAVLKKCAYGKNENIILSPFSVLMLLAIAADATCGKTREEIANILSDTIHFEEVRDLLCEIQNELTDKKTFSSANALCVHHEIENQILPDYKANLHSRFGGELFASGNLVEDVNAWVNVKTSGLIPQIINIPISDETLAYLLNAVSFKADWLIKFDEERIAPEKYENADGTTAEIPMLHGIENSYIEDENITGFVKPYKEEYSFMALLPKEKGRDALMKTLEHTDFTELYFKQTYAEVSMAMPEFSYSFEKNITETCKELGIHKLFEDDAEFSPMTSAALKAGSIVHKARIELDRKGTKAAAVTGFGFMLASCLILGERKRVYLTRPFIYAIIHNKTGLPVFTGVFNNVKK